MNGISEDRAWINTVKIIRGWPSKAESIMKYASKDKRGKWLRRCTEQSRERNDPSIQCKGRYNPVSSFLAQRARCHAGHKSGYVCHKSPEFRRINAFGLDALKSSRGERGYLATFT